MTTTCGHEECDMEPCLRAPEFVPFPKIARLNRPCLVTEKIDGTNAAIGGDHRWRWPREFESVFR